jgi:hypothetical protein
MGRFPKDLLRPLTGEEQGDLESISRARSAPVEAVIRAKILLAVASGMNYTQAAQQVGRKSNDAVSPWSGASIGKGWRPCCPVMAGGFNPNTEQRKKRALGVKWSVSPTWNRTGPPPGR